MTQLYIVLTGIILLSAQTDQIPIPQNRAAIDPAYVVLDNNLSEEIVTNQLLLLFKKDVTGSNQKRIIDRVGGRIIGGVPDMNIYQIGIVNSRKSVEYIRAVCNQLEEEDAVISATPRRADEDKVQKVSIDKAPAPKRQGTLQMNAVGREEKSQDQPGIDEIINNHRPDLSSCIKNRKSSGQEILFRISISPAGQVTEVKALKSEITDRKILDCLIYRIKKWNDFPPEDRPYDRQVEFSFEY